MNMHQKSPVFCHFCWFLDCATEMLDADVRCGWNSRWRSPKIIAHDVIRHAETKVLLVFANTSGMSRFRDGHVYVETGELTLEDWTHGGLDNGGHCRKRVEQRWPVSNRSLLASNITHQRSLSLWAPVAIYLPVKHRGTWGPLAMFLPRFYYIYK